MADLNALMFRLRALDEMERNCLDDNESKAVADEREALMSRVGTVTQEDVISFENGLRFIRLAIEEKSEANDARAIRMTTKLMRIVNKVSVAIPVETTQPASKRARIQAPTGPPFTRPRGAAPKGKVWSATRGCWVELPGYVS